MNQESIIAKCDKCGTKNRVPRNRLHDNPVCGKCKSALMIDRVRKVPVEVSDQTFQREVISYPCPVLVDCWAPWCGPCRMVAPVLDQLAADYSGRIRIAKLNVDKNPVTASKYGVQSIPTMLIFKNGNQVNRLVGALPREEIERHLAAIL
jgi:thioredoxin 2